MQENIFNDARANSYQISENPYLSCTFTKLFSIKLLFRILRQACFERIFRWLCSHQKQDFAFMFTTQLLFGSAARTKIFIHLAIA